MRTRRVKKDNDKLNVVWFGSYGKNSDGTAKFYNPDDKHDNYSDEQQGVADSLMQRLSVIEGELWYNVEIGLPLLEKNKTKLSMDAAVSEMILEHPNVIQIEQFESEIINNKYSAYVIIQSTYGTLELTV